MAKVVFTFETEDWARWPEVLEYARQRGVDLHAAVVELVNSGLSVYPGWLTTVQDLNGQGWDGYQRARNAALAGDESS